MRNYLTTRIYIYAHIMSLSFPLPEKSGKYFPLLYKRSMVSYKILGIYLSIHFRCPLLLKHAFKINLRTFGAVRRDSGQCNFQIVIV